MPPAIIAGAIAIGASAAAAASIITVTTAMVIVAAATLAGALMTKANVPSITGFTGQAERKQVLRSSSAPKTFVYGETVTSGLLFFAEEEDGEQDEDEWLHMGIAVCAHEIDSITSIWLGDDLIQDYGEYAQYQVHNNDSVAAADMLSRCPSWRSDMIGRGICWVRISLKFNQEKFPAGVPNVKFKVRGKKCLDPRSGQVVWTANPALCIMDYYRTVLGVTDDRLILDEFIEGANICDESINGNDYSEPRYRLNGTFDSSEAISSTLDDLHMACGGEATYIGGQHGIVVGAYYGPATMVLDEGQIIDNIKIIPETSWSEKVNTVSGTFIDPEQGYTKVDFPTVQVPSYVLEDGNEFTDDVEYRFVTSVYQAQRLAQININRKRLGRTVEVPLNFLGYMYRPGYYVKLNIPSLGINMEEFRVTKWTLDPMGGGINVTLRQETAAVWGDAVGQPIDRPDLTNLPGPSVPAPTNVQWIPVADDAELNYQGVVSWVNPSTVDFTQVIIQGNGRTIVSKNSTSQSIQVNGLDKGTTYTVYLRNSAKGGILSNIATLQFTLTIDSKYYGDIYARNGYFMGTVYANNIVGDIYNKMSGGLSMGPFNYGSAGDHVMWNIEGEVFDRVLDSNMIMSMGSSDRQYFTILVRTPGRPDVQIGYFDTGNGGENSPGYLALEGITIPATATRDEMSQIVVNVGENRPATVSLTVPLDIQKLVHPSGSSVNWLVETYREQKSWVALYKKGRTPVHST